MFDHGFTNYMKHAFPKDNLLPISCGGRDWQGGLAITLVDSLDALVLLNRRQDVVDSVDLVRKHLTFDKDIKVHVFETVIRVLGGLLSGHMLLERNPQLAAGLALVPEQRRGQEHGAGLDPEQLGQGQRQGQRLDSDQGPRNGHAGGVNAVGELECEQVPTQRQVQADRSADIDRTDLGQMPEAAAVAAETGAAAGTGQAKAGTDFGQGWPPPTPPEGAEVAAAAAAVTTAAWHEGSPGEGSGQLEQLPDGPAGHQESAIGHSGEDTSGVAWGHDGPTPSTSDTSATVPSEGVDGVAGAEAGSAFPGPDTSAQEIAGAGLQAAATLATADVSGTGAGASAEPSTPEPPEASASLAAAVETPEAAGHSAASDSGTIDSAAAISPAVSDPSSICWAVERTPLEPSAASVAEAPTVQSLAEPAPELDLQAAAPVSANALLASPEDVSPLPPLPDSQQPPECQQELPSSAAAAAATTDPTASTAFTEQAAVVAADQGFPQSPPLPAAEAALPVETLTAGPVSGPAGWEAAAAAAAGTLGTRPSTAAAAAAAAGPAEADPNRDQDPTPGPEPDAPPPLYDGIFLRKAVQLADRLLPAFDTPSGLPSLFVHLRKGPISDAYNSTCTACAGTLLLEFGMLTALTGNPVYLERAEFAARLLYDRRSRLGLVGASLNVVSTEWANRESTIGPGSDSYYEYLLKAYLLFGKAEYLNMFAELYTSTMRWMQMPGTFKGYSFMVDVHMDSGRIARPFVSSLGAFWPGMQALAGQEQDAIDLHANFTAAWRAFGWLPEVFGIDLSKVHPEDPGYNLRPEHIESTYLLHCLTQDPAYLRIARNIQSTLQDHNRVMCGFTNVNHVDTGEHGDLMESYFLSETAKYLYLMFSSAPGLIDYYVLTTEGHLMPPLVNPAALHASRLRERATSKAAPQAAGAGESSHAGPGPEGPEGRREQGQGGADAALAPTAATVADRAQDAAVLAAMLRRTRPAAASGQTTSGGDGGDSSEDYVQALLSSLLAAVEAAGAAAATEQASPTVDSAGAPAAAATEQVTQTVEAAGAAAVTETKEAALTVGAAGVAGAAAEQTAPTVKATSAAAAGQATPEVDTSDSSEEPARAAQEPAIPPKNMGQMEAVLPAADGWAAAPSSPVAAASATDADAAAAAALANMAANGGGGGGGGRSLTELLAEATDTAAAAAVAGGAGGSLLAALFGEASGGGDMLMAAALAAAAAVKGNGAGRALGAGSAPGQLVPAAVQAPDPGGPVPASSATLAEGGGTSLPAEGRAAASGAASAPRAAPYVVAGSEGELEIPSSIPANCMRVCTSPTLNEEAATEARLRAAFPLLAFRRADAELVRHRRCVACVVVSARMAEQPPEDDAVRARIMKLPQENIDEVAAAQQQEANQHVLAQAVCTIKVSRDGAMSCNNIRAITQHDAQHGVPYNAVILQISAVQDQHLMSLMSGQAAQQTGSGSGGAESGSSRAGSSGSSSPKPTPADATAAAAAAASGPESESGSCSAQDAPARTEPQGGGGETGSAPAEVDEYALIIVRGGAAGEVSYVFEGMTALFGPALAEATSRCLQHLLAASALSLSAGCDGHLHTPREELYGRLYGGGATCPAYLDSPLRRHRMTIMAQGTGAATGAAATEDLDVDCGSAALWHAKRDERDAWAASSAAAVLHVSNGGGGVAVATDGGYAGNVGTGGRAEEVTASQPQVAEMEQLQLQPQPAAAVAPEEAREGTAEGPAPDDASAPAGATARNHSDWVQPEGPPWWENSHLSGPCDTRPVFTAPLALAQPLDGCSPPTNSEALVEGIAVMARGNCTFARKILHAQAAGAVAVMVLNLQGPGELLSMAPDVPDRTVEIPAVLIGPANSRRLLRALSARDRAAGIGTAEPPIVASLAHLPPHMMLRATAAAVAAAAAGAASGAGGAGGGAPWTAAEGGAAGSAASGGGGGGRSLNTRLDLLIPSGSHAFLAANVMAKGRTLQQLFEALLGDGRAVALLQQLAQKGAAQLMQQLVAQQRAQEEAAAQLAAARQAQQAQQQQQQAAPATAQSWWQHVLQGQGRQGQGQGQQEQRASP